MQPKKNTIALICLVFFLSGCSALIFETVWFHIASLVLGSSVWSAAAVLMAFMTGLAIGNAWMAMYGHRIKNSFRFYVLIELAIGISGVSAVLMLPTLSPFIVERLAHISNQTMILNSARFLIAFFVLLIPAVAMGTTLPILQKLIHKRDVSFASSIGRLYGWNTIGALAGVLAAEFLLIKLIGIIGSALTACALNLIAALLILNNFKHESLETNSGASDRHIGSMTDHKKFLFPPFMTGLILLALEIVWFRYMLLAHDGTSTTFSIMLATILCGIGVGGLIVSRLKPQPATLIKLQIVLPLLAAFITIASFVLYSYYFDLYLPEITTFYWYFIGAALLLMLPVSIISGMLFPLYGEMIYLQTAGITLSSGTLTLVNTLGAAIGSGLASFFLLPKLGIENSIILLSSGYMLTGLFFYFYTQTVKSLRSRLNVGAAVIVFIIALWFTTGTVERSYQQLGEKIFPGWTLVKMREGLNQTLGYFKKDSFGKPLIFKLVTNNHSMSATFTPSKRYMKFYVYFPYVIQKNIKSVLQICYGVGNTAEAVVRLDTVEYFDLVDLSPDILELSHIVHDTTGIYPLRDPRTHVHVEDGRFFLQTSPRQYDLITAEPPPPKQAGVASLYSKEYFSLIRDKLTPNGMATYWLPVHDLYDSNSLSIILAFCDSFPDCSLWNGAGLDFMLVGTKNGIKPITDEAYRASWNSVIAEDLASIGFETPGQLAATFMADSKTLRELTLHTLPVSDNFPKRISSSPNKPSEYSELYAFLLNIERRKKEFQNSEYIKSFLSPKTIESALPAFRDEAILTSMWASLYNNVTVGNIDYIDELNKQLSNNSGYFFATMIFGSSPDEQKIIRNAKGAITETDNYQLSHIKYLMINRKFSAASSTAWNLTIQHQKSAVDIRESYQLYLLAMGLDHQADKAQRQLLPCNDEFMVWYNHQYPTKACRPQ
jgi:spermidine synthase